jgi:hypothetical protein
MRVLLKFQVNCHSYTLILLYSYLFVDLRRIVKLYIRIIADFRFQEPFTGG